MADRGNAATRWATGLRRLAFLLLATALLSASGCAWLDTKQRNIIYRPTPGVPADFAGLRAGDERFFVDVPAAFAAPVNAPANAPIAPSMAAPQQIEMWWLPHTNSAAPTLLYYHGTFRNLYQNLPKIDALREAGFSILAVDYRGWGRSTRIVPSELTILQDANLAWAQLRLREPRASHRVLYGHSMGSGVAVDIASRLQAPVDYAAVILESAFTSFPDIAKQASWLGGLAKVLNNERFASIDKISQVQAPLLMLHGTLDKTVPITLGEKLFAAARAPKQWQAIDGAAHSDLQKAGSVQYQTTLETFKNKYVLGLPPKKILHK